MSKGEVASVMMRPSIHVHNHADGKRANIYRSQYTDIRERAGSVPAVISCST